MSGCDAKSRNTKRPPKYELQVPLEIHALMKDAYDQNAFLGLAVENRMTTGFYFSVAGPDMARIAPDVGKVRQHLERPMYS